MAAGIRQRHGRGCAAQGRCKCPYEASVYSKQDGKKSRKTFPTQAAAKVWRDDASGQVRRNLLRAPVPTTRQKAADTWPEGPRAGVTRIEQTRLARHDHPPPFPPLTSWTMN
jgi:hypothetical protein